MADPIYTSASPIAVNPANGELIGGATFTVHAPDDTSFSTPLAVTDPNTGVAINPLRSNSNGTLPAFKVAGDLPRVKLKSGAFVTELVSLGGLVVEQIAAAGLDPETVSSAIAAAGTATTKAGEASASATAAADAATTATQKASAVAQVVATNDGIMATVFGQEGSAFRAELSAAIAQGSAAVAVQLVASASLATIRQSLPNRFYVRETASPAPTVVDYASPADAGIVGTSAEWDVGTSSKFARFVAGGSYIDEGGRWGATQNRGTTGPMSTLFHTDGAYVVIKFRSWPGHMYRVLVDGQYATDVNGVAGAGNGSERYLKITFSDARRRRVRIDHTGQIMKVITPTGYGAWAAEPRGPRVACVGDSYTGGAGVSPAGYNSLSSWPWLMGARMQWDDVINAGIGGSGWIAKGNPAANFEDRIANIIAWNPDVVIFSGDQNDSANTAAVVAAAVTRTLQGVRAGLPAAVIITTGGFHAGLPVNGSDDPYWGPRQTAILAAAAPFGPTIRTTDQGIFTGTGKAGTPGTGNGERYIQSDGIHPTQAGADSLGDFMAEAVVRAIKGR